MKKITSIAIVVLFAALLISDGCKKEEDKVLNKITIAGNTDELLNGDYIPETGYYNSPQVWDCPTTMYRSAIWVTFTSGEALWMNFYQPASTPVIPLGTFHLSTECIEGFTVEFYSGQAQKTAGLGFTTGTITVSKTGDIYDVDVYLEIDMYWGDGTIKGNFHGPIDPGVN